MAMVRILAACLPIASAVSLGSTASVRLANDESAGLAERPVMKVVRLLQDMHTQLVSDLDEDKTVHEQLGCWCETNRKEKTQAIDEGESKVEQLKSSLSEAAAQVAELKTRRKQTMDELQADRQALQTASELRLKESKEFHKEETSLMSAISACKQAIVVLSKQHPELVQLKSVAEVLQAARVMDLAARSRPGSRPQALSDLKSFLQGVGEARASSFLEVPGFQSYAPQSGQIFGILKQMKDDFSEDLSSLQKTEAKAAEDFATLKSAKKDEIKLGEKDIATIDEQLADASEKSAQEAQELEDTEETLAQDKKFLAELEEKCSESESEYEKRTKSRLAEIAAVEDTIKILNNEEAFNNFDKTLVSSFLQVQQLQRASSSQTRQRVVEVLQAAAQRSGRPELALVATSAKLDAFTEVKAEIEKLVAELKKQQQDEVEHRDWCIEEFAQNKRASTKAYDEKESVSTSVADLEKSISTLQKDIEAATASIAEMKKQMDQASSAREAEAAEAQRTITDQRLTQTILRKAIARMKQVYALLQQQESADSSSEESQAPAEEQPDFKPYKEHEGGSQVVRLLEGILNDSKDTEDDALREEEDAQSAYEELMKNSNTAIALKSEAITNLMEREAKNKELLVIGKKDLAATLGELESLHGEEATLHKSCDYIMDNFTARQEARANEIAALGEAKSILSGAKS